jgi:hypothetical protein
VLPIPIKIAGCSPNVRIGSTPLKLGLPLAQGVTTLAEQVCVFDTISEKSLRTQVKPLNRWPDGSIRWCQLEWVNETEGTVPSYEVRLRANNQQDEAGIQKWVLELSADTETCHICSTAVEGKLSFKLSGTDEFGEQRRARFTLTKATENGTVRERTVLAFSLGEGNALSAIQGLLRIDAWADLSMATFRARVRNPNPAAHPNGNWDLGNAGSVYFRDLSLEFLHQDNLTVAALHTIATEAKIDFKDSATLFQASSGGDNWSSSNHLDRDRRVPMPFRGFEAMADGKLFGGMRASPQVYVTTQSYSLGLACQRFWENFPMALSVGSRSARISLWPKESGYLHELQGGEQKSYEFAIYYGPRNEGTPLAWHTDGITAFLDPAHYCSTGAIPYLTEKSTDPNQKYLQLADQAIDGNDTFWLKREKIDQYGWRNFGDIYGDHEAVYHSGPTPMISHYNNQYDCTGAFAIQFMRSGDLRWYEQMVQMADHAWDIDTYHTDGDKSLYNGGLFWHTYHYADADTGTHRSYPKRLTQSHFMPGGKDLEELGKTGEALMKVYAVGGGPSASQNYSTGWMWAFYLTGEEEYREAAINAADYVINIEDGRKTVFSWFTRRDTGLSIESGVGYYGPGRASGNSLHALLTGFELTGELKYLNAAEQLIERVAHPQDDFDKLDLLNVELRWFYVMYLQALARYIEIKHAYAMNDMHYAYAWATLNHYAKWMLENERPNLAQKDKLQYPTETWVAQDMRKWQVLQFAAQINRAQPDLYAKYQAKADFFFDYVCDTLDGFPTKSLCRPVVLLMQFGWQRAWCQNERLQMTYVEPQHVRSFPAKIDFRPQRQVAIKRAKYCVVVAAVLVPLAVLTAIFVFFFL